MHFNKDNNESIDNFKCTSFVNYLTNDIKAVVDDIGKRQFTDNDDRLR